MRKNYHPIISAIISILFIVVVQMFAAPQPVFRFLLPAFICYLAAVTGYNYVFLRRDNAEHYNVWTLLRPLLFLMGWFGVYFIIPNEWWRGVYLLAGLPVIYLLEQTLGNSGEQLLFNETLLMAFTSLFTVTALSHYFLLPGTLYLLMVFALTVLIVRASYELTPQSKQMKWVCAICLGFVVAEIFWAASFLPLHYSAVGLLIFNVFYCAWTLCYYFLYNHLTVKKIQFHIVLAVLFSLLIVAVTPWRILQ